MHHDGPILAFSFEAGTTLHGICLVERCLMGTVVTCNILSHPSWLKPSLSPKSKWWRRSTCKDTRQALWQALPSHNLNEIRWKGKIESTIRAPSK